MPSRVQWAFVFALILAALNAFQFINTPLALPGVLFYLSAAIGLYRKSAWSGFGPALITLISAATVAVLIYRFEDRLTIAVAVFVLLGFSLVCYRAGKTLQLEGNPTRGKPLWLSVAVLTGLLSVLTIVCPAFKMPTGSMENTLQIGDALFVRPTTSVARGDLVVFRYPVDEKQNFIKRIVGMPGDRIRIVDKRLILNGKAVDEPYVLHRTGYMDSYRDNFPSAANIRLEAGAQTMLTENVENGDVVVPANSYFVLGDNRDNSLDSRYWGFVPKENLFGKPFFVYWSYDEPEEDLVGFRSTLFQFWEFKRIRWNRILLRIHGDPLQ